MKHLESRLVGASEAFLPIGKEHDIANVISERVG